VKSINRKENESAVSPIVATLVLIVVAVVGAVAVGTIMGTFSSDVAEKTSVGETGAAASAELLIGGSTTVQPVSEEIEKAYKKVSPGVEVAVTGGGSGAGVNAVGMGTIDIGSSSDLTKITSAKSAHPEWDLRETQIGGSGVVFIVSEPIAVAGNVTKAALTDLYQNGNVPANLPGITQIYQRAESSGTEETAAEYLGGPSKSFDTWTAGGKSYSAVGNSGVLAAVKASSTAIGFVDMGFAYDTAGNEVAGIDVVSIDGYPDTKKDHIKDAAKNKLAGTTSSKYPVELARGLYYITAGEPSILEKDFIAFAASPASIDAVHAAGVFHVLDLM
jgi:phosphate transport system substrate-binding protein